jgi:hypothetical protein
MLTVIVASSTINSSLHTAQIVSPPSEQNEDITTTTTTTICQKSYKKYVSNDNIFLPPIAIVPRCRLASVSSVAGGTALLSLS